MVNYNYLIIGFLAFIIIFIIFYFLNKNNIIKIPGFSKNTIDITVNSKNSKCDISITDNCKCKINYTDESKSSNNYSEDLNSYNLEKKYYKIKQDLVPYWKFSNWMKKTHIPEYNEHVLIENRIYQPEQNIYFDENNKRVEKKIYTEGKIPSYKVNVCDLVPCKNLGYKYTNNPRWNKLSNPLVCDLKNTDYHTLDPSGSQFNNINLKSSIWTPPKNLNQKDSVAMNSPSYQTDVLLNSLSGLNFNNCTNGDNYLECPKTVNVFNILKKFNGPDKIKNTCSTKTNRYINEGKYLNLNQD